MSAISYLKNASLPTIDDALRYTGLQRSPSIFSRMLAGASLLGLGLLVGGGLALWLGSPKNRKRLSTTLIRGIDILSAAVGVDEDRSRNGVSGTAKNNHPHSGRAAHAR